MTELQMVWFCGDVAFDGHISLIFIFLKLMKIIMNWQTKLCLSYVVYYLGEAFFYYFK